MENTKIPLSFDTRALQGQLDDISKIMNKAFGSFGGTGQFKSLSTAMNSFKGSFGTINKSLKSIDTNLSSLVTNINNVTGSLQSTNKEINALQKGTKDSVIITDKLAGSFGKVELGVSNVQSMLKKPLNLDIDTGDTDLIGPLEKQLKIAKQRVDEVFKTGTEGKVKVSLDTRGVRDGAVVINDVLDEVKSTVTRWSHGVAIDLVTEPTNAINKFSNVFKARVDEMEKFKPSLDRPVRMFSQTGKEEGAMASAVNSMHKLSDARKEIDVEALKSFEAKPFDNLAKSLRKAGVEFSTLLEATKAFNVLKVTGEKHIDVNVRRTKEYRALVKATDLYTEAMTNANKTIELTGSASESQIVKLGKLKKAMDTARKSVDFKGEMVSVNALTGNLQDLGEVAGTKVANAFHKLAGSSKEIGKKTWAEVFEAKDVTQFQVALVNLSKKLQEVGKTNPQIEALHRNFGDIKQIAETHFAAKMAKDFDESSKSSILKIGAIKEEITKLHSQMGKGIVKESDLVEPYKRLEKEVARLILQAKTLDIALDQIEQFKGIDVSTSARGIGGASTGSAASTSATRETAVVYSEDLARKEVSSLSSLQSELRQTVKHLQIADTQLKVSRASFVSWGEARKKAVFDLSKISFEFKVPVEDVSRVDIVKRQQQYVEYQKQIDALVKKRSQLDKASTDTLGLMSKEAIPIRIKITADQKAIDKEIKEVTQRFQVAMAKEPEIKTEVKAITGAKSMQATQRSFSKFNKQLLAMTDSANIALRNIRMDEALDPKEAEALMKPLQNLISEFTALQEDIKLIDGAITKLGTNPTEEQMVKTWANLETVFKRAYEKMNLFSGVYDRMSKGQIGATAATKEMITSLESLMQKPVRAAKSFNLLIDTMLKAQGIAGKTDLAIRLKSPDKAIRDHAKKVSESITKAKTQLDMIAGEAISPEANIKIKQSIKKAEKEYVKQVAESQKRAKQKLDKLVAKAKRGPEVSRIGAIETAEGAFDREIGRGIETAKRSLEREKERILDVPVKLKPSVAADEVLKKWKSAIRVLVTEFGQGGGLAAREFQKMYMSTAGGFKFDQSLYGVASKTKTLLGQTGKFFREMGSRSGDVLPLNEYEDLIKKMKEFRRVGGLSSTAVNPIIELGSVVTNATNVFDKMKLAVKASAPPETIAAIQKEIDQFIELRQISKDSTAQLSKQSKETRGLGFSMDKFGYAIDLLIQYLEKAILKFQGLGKTAHTALGSIKSGMKGQAGLFKKGLGEMEGPMFEIKPEGFKMAEPLGNMFAEMYSASFNSLQDLRKVTDKGLTAWSVSFKGGLSKTDKVVKQNSSKLIGGLSKLKRQIFIASDINWGKLLDPEGAALLKKSAETAGMQIKELQSNLAKFKTGKIKEVKTFPTVKSLQTQLKTVLAVSEEVQRKITAGEVGMEHFPAVDRLQQYALQLTAAISMIEKPYKSMAGLASKEDKISSKQLGKSFRAGITGAQKELENAVKQVKAPMKSVMVRLFEDVLSMTPAEIPQAASMMKNLAGQFPSQMQSAFNAMGKKKYDLGRFIAKMFKIDPGAFKTVEEAVAKHGAEIPEMLLRAIFPTEGQAQFAVKAKKMANQIITAPLNKALKSAGDVTMPKFEVFRIGEEMMRNAKFDGEKFTQVKSQYGTHISGLIKEIDRLMKTSPSKKMKPILEKIFSPTDVSDINAYATGMKGALSNIKTYLQKATAGKLSKEQLAAGMGLQEELKTAGLEVDENELAQMFEKMYNKAGQSLKDFVSQEKKWSAESITDLMKLMEYWENLGGMVDMVTKKLPKVSSMKTVADVMFKDKDVGAIKAGKDMARLMVKSLESTLSEGGKIKTPLAAMIGRSPEVIFEIMRGTNQKLKNELKDMGFNLRGSTKNMIKSINELSEARITTTWFEQYREANERFYLEGEKTGVTLDSIRRGFATITPLSSAGLSELATRSQDFLNRAGIAFESFSANLFKHSVDFNTFSDKQKANVSKYTNILSRGVRTIGQFMQEDPFSGSIMRLVRNENVLWEKLIAAADKGGNKLKMSIQSELVRAHEVGARKDIDLGMLYKETGDVPAIQEIIGQLKELRRTKQAVDKEMIAPGARPFATLIKDASTLQGTMLSALGSISQGLSRVGKTGKVDIDMKDSVRDLDTITQHLNILQAEINETIAYAKKTGQVLPLEFQLVARSVAEMGSSLHSSYSVLKKLPTHAHVSEVEMEKLAESVNKSASALKKFDQIDLKEFNQKLGVAMSTAMNKVNAFAKSAKIKPSFQLGKTGIDKIMRAEGAESNKMIQQWRESAVAGGDSWKQMIMFLKGLEPEMKGIFERFASKPRLLLKAFDKMTPQMKVLMSLYFTEMGHATSAGFNKWMTTYDKYFSGMTKTNKIHLETFLSNTSKTMASFKAPDVTKFFPPDTGMETDKTTDGLKRLGNAMAKLGVNMKELKALSGDTSWLTKWGEAFAKPIPWDFGPGKGKEIQLTGTFSMFGKAITQVGEGLDVLVTQLHRVGKETESGSVQKGIKELVNLISKLDSELRKTSKYKLSLGAGLGESLKPLRDVGYAINSFFDSMAKIKSASDFSLTQKEVKTFGRVIVVTMAQIATVIKPAIESLGRFASNETVKRFSRFAQGLKDLVLATKDLYQLTAVFSEVEKDSKSSATALGHFEKVISSMVILLNKMPDIAGKLSIISINNDQINNAKRLSEVLRPLAQSLLLIGEAFKKGVNVDANMKKFAASLKGMIDVIRSIDLDPVTKDLLNDVRKLTQIFSSKALIAAPDEAEQRLEMLAKVVEQGTNKVAQKTKQGLQKIQQASKPKSKQDFLSDLGVTPGATGGAAADITTDMADVLTSFSEPVQDFGAGEQAMTHLAGAGKEVGKALQIVNSAVSKLGAEFKGILPGEEKFISELVQLAALNPAAAIDKLNIKLNSLGKNLAGDSLKKAQIAIQGFIIEVMNGAAGLKSMGAAGVDLQKIHDGLNKDTVSAKDLTVALTSVKGVLRSVETESAKLDLQNRLLKTRGEAVGVHAEIKSLLNSMRAMGPEFRKSLSTGDARREFLSYANELGAKLETAMGPMRSFTGFKGVNEEIKKMTSSMGLLKSQSQGMVTLADRFTGKLRIAGDQFLNLVAYQTRWYVSQQIFFMGFGQLEKILSNFGALDKQVRRVLRVLRDSNNAVLGIDSSIRALAGAGTAWAQEWAKNMEVMFKAQTRTTFYNLFKQLGATSEEIGESMYQLGSAGLQANEVMSAIEPTLRMIIATEGEVKDTTRLIAGVFNLYGDSIEGARTSTEKFVYITDVLTATFRDHMVTIGELITGISYTIATAKLSGMQFEEVTAALATLNDNMLKGSKAGRAFNRMLLNSTKRLDETKDILQAIGSQANVGVDLSRIFEGLEAEGARPFDYIIQAGIAMQEQLKTANLTVDNLTQTFKAMGVVGARAFAILLLKAGDYEKTLFQLKYAAFSAGEDMSELLIGGFDRSIHRIEGFTRAGYARLMGIARGGITVLASSVQGLESTIKKVSKLSFIPDIPDVKSYISFFGIVATGAAIMAGMKKKPLPGMDALRFDKWASGINKFTVGIDQNRTALKLLNIELKKTGLNAISLGQAYETASNKMSTMGKIGSTISLFKGLRGSVENFKPQQQLIISGLKDIERAFSKVTSGKWSMGDLDTFMSQMKTVREFEPTFAARGQEFTIKTNLTRTIDEFQKGSISAKQFEARLGSVYKEVIKASGISNLTTKLNVLEKEFTEGSIVIEQYNARLRALGLEANKIGKIKAFGLEAVSARSFKGLGQADTIGFADSFKNMEKIKKVFSSSFEDMSKIGITSMDQVFKFIRNPEAWNKFSDNAMRSYSKLDSGAKRVSNKFRELMDQMIEPAHRAAAGISRGAMEVDFVKQTKNMSIFKESWKGLAEGIGFNTEKTKSFWSTLKGFLGSASRGVSSFGSDFDRAVAKREALTKLSSGFRSLGAGIKSAAVAVKGFMSATIAMAAFSLILQKIFEGIEKVTRGTEYWAQQLGATNAEFNKSVASLMGNISGITRYVNKLTELRKAMDMHIKIRADVESEEFEQDLSHLRGLLEGTAEFENFEFHVRHGDVVDAAIAWRELSKVIKNLSEETSAKAIGRFVELGSSYKDAAKIYKETIETSLEGSSLESAWSFITGKEVDTSLKFDAKDWGQPDKIKFKRQGQEAAKLILDSVKVVMQQGATTFDFVWDDEVLASFDKRLSNTADSAILFGDSLETTDLKFSSFIKNIKRNVKTAELFDVFKEVGKDLNKVFQVEGAEEFSTFMKMFPNLASESNDEVRGLAESWASMGEDERAVVLINAARKDLKLFHQSMKAISSDTSMLQAADSTKKFVDIATADIAMLNTSISQMGGTLASQFEENWDRTWGQWVESGVTAAIDVERSLSGTFRFGSQSVLGKLERDISKTTKPIVDSFTKAYTTVGSVWAKESSKLIKDNKLPEAFASWGNELKIALSGPWAKAKRAQDDWRNGMNNAVDAAVMRFKLLQDSMSTMGSLVAEEWRRAQSSVVNTSFGSEQEGENSVEEFSKGMEKSLKEAIKAGHKGVQELAKTMSTDVAGAIDLTIKRMEVLTSIIAKAQSLSVEVQDTMSKWEGGITLANKVLGVTLEYLKKFTKNADISKTVRDMNVALIKNEKLKAKEKYEREKALGGPEEELKGAKTYLDTLSQINEKLMSSAVESLKKHIADKSKAEKDAIINRHKREDVAAKESLALQKSFNKEKLKDAKIQTSAMKKVEKIARKKEGPYTEEQKIKREESWRDTSQAENKRNSEFLRQQKLSNDDAAKALKARHVAEIKAFDESGGKTAKSMQKLALIIADIKSGALKISGMDELSRHITLLGDPELSKNFGLYIKEIKDTNVEINAIGEEAKVIAARAEKDYLEVKTSLKSLVELQDKLTKYSETMAKQSKVIADLLKREGLVQAIQALGAMGFNVKLDEEGMFKDSKTLEMFNTLIGEASDGLVDMANRLQKQVQRQPVEAFGLTETKPINFISEISKQLYNLGESFPQVGSQVDELGNQFLIQVERMRASGKTQEEIDSRLNTVLTSITGVTTDAKNLDPAALGSFLDDITNMIKITSTDLKSIDTSKLDVVPTRELLKQQIVPTESENVLRRVQENQSKIDSFVNELPQWSEVADNVEKVVVSTFEVASKSQQKYFDTFHKKTQKESIAAGVYRRKDGVLQRKTEKVEVVLGKMVPLDITKVIDADTIQTEIDGMAVNLRLAFIDALDPKQAGGALQTEAMEGLIEEYKKAGYEIQAFFKEYDEKTNRLITDVFATKDGESISINQEAIARGIASVFIPDVSTTLDDREIIKGYTAIQESAKQFSAGIHGFEQWLSIEHPEMRMQLPEDFRDIIGSRDSDDIRVALENEAKLKAAMNEYLKALGKGPLYTDKEMIVTDNAVEQLLKLGSTKGSIYVHDFHLDKSIKTVVSEISNLFEQSAIAAQEYQNPPTNLIKTVVSEISDLFEQSAIAAQEYQNPPADSIKTVVSEISDLFEQSAIAAQEYQNPPVDSIKTVVSEISDLFEQSAIAAQEYQNIPIDSIKTVVSEISDLFEQSAIAAQEYQNIPVESTKTIVSEISDLFEQSIAAHELSGFIKTLDLSGLTGQPEKIKSLSLGSIGELISVQDATTGMTHAFQTVEEVTRKLGAATVEMLQIKQREREYEAAHPKSEAAFFSPEGPVINYEVQAAADVIPRIADENIRIFRDMASGVVCATDTLFTGAAAKMEQNASEVSRLMQGIQDVFGQDLTNALSNALPALGSEAQGSVDELIQKFSKLGEETSTIEIQGFLEHLQGLSNKMLDVQSNLEMPDAKYGAKAEQFADVLSEVNSKIKGLDFTEQIASSLEPLDESAINAAEGLTTFNSKVVNSADNTSDAFSFLAQAAKSAASAMASIKRSGARTGTVLPGYGGGDSLPFDLEPGEAVINKEAVRMFGKDLFNAYNQGKAGAVSMPSVGKRLAGVRSVVKKKVLNDDSPIRKFDINLAGIPFKGLATEDMINQLGKGLRRKQLVGQNL